MNNYPPNVNFAHEHCYMCNEEIAPHDGIAFCSDKCQERFENGHDEYPEEYDYMERDQSDE